MKKKNLKKRKYFPYRWLRNLIWDIQFNLKEIKLREEVEAEIEQVDSQAKHGSMDDFRIYKQYMQEYEERKQQHNLRKLQ